MDGAPAGRRRRRQSAGRRRLGRRPTARDGGARRGGSGRPTGEALERHRVGARRGVADQAVGQRAGMGGCVRHGAGGRAHDHEAVVAAPLGTRRVGAARPRVLASRLAHVPPHRRVRHRSRRRVRHRLLRSRARRVPARPAGDRRRRCRLGAAAATRARSDRRGRHAGCGDRRARHRRQHGGRARHRARVG